MIRSLKKSLIDAASRCIYGAEQVTLKESFYELVDKNMDGKVVPMSSFEGDVLLVVNVASQ